MGAPPARDDDTPASPRVPFRRVGLDARDDEAVRRMLDAGWDMQALYDVAGNYVAVSEASTRLFGWEPSELIGTSSYDYFHPDDLAAIRAAHDQVLDDDAPAIVTYRLRCKDGSYRWVEVVGVGLQRADGGGHDLIHCTTRDITERHRLEEENARIAAALRDREERYRLTVEHSGVGMALVALDGTWLDVNAAMCRLLGRTADELRATTFQAITHPDDLDADLGEMQALLDGTSDGYAMDKRYLRPDGSIVHARLHGTVVRDRDGRASYFIAQVLDLSDRVRAEEAERAIERSHRFQLVGSLAAKIAHQFNNVLAEMSIDLELLESELGVDAGARHDVTSDGDPSAVSEYLERLRTSIGAATGVTRGLQVLGGDEPSAEETVDLGAIVRRAAEHLDRVLGPEVVIDATSSDGRCAVRGDRERITTALLALLVNASEAMEGRGRIRVEVRCGSDVEGTPSTLPDPNVRWAVIRVIDRGVGMAAEVLDQVLEPYVSTRSGHLGTGLTVARQVAESAGGVLELRSEPRQGTTASLWFPQVVAEEAAVGTAPDVTFVVLAVDDRADLLSLVARALRRSGLEVHTAQGPLQALELVDERGVVPDVVVTDIVMPSMNGVELVGRLRADLPDLGVVFMSGYSGLGDEVAAVPGARFLAKPFAVRDLLDAVRAARATPPG